MRLVALPLADLNFDVYGHLRPMGDTEQLGALDKYLPEFLDDAAPA